MRATSLGGGCLSDLLQPHLMHSHFQGDSVSMTAGPFPQGLQVSLVQLEKRAPQGGRGAWDLQAHQAPKGEPGPKGRRVVCGGEGGRREG